MENNEELCEIHFSAGSIEEARRVGRYLVQEKLVASAQIIPWVESIYLWNGALETGQESLLILKTRVSFFEEISTILKKNSRYEIPEIVLFSLEKVNSPYQEWLLSSTNNTRESSL